MENMRGAALIVAAMAVFAIEDMFIKKLSMSGVPLGQILCLLGFGGGTIFAIVAQSRGERVLSPLFFERAVVFRNLGEIIGTLGFVVAITLTPISSASAIFQANPLAVTLGAALFLNETVGWRRWSAIVVGFLGVLLIVRPGTEHFDPKSLFAVLAVFGLALRDLATRVIPKTVTSFQLSAWGFSTLIPAGLLLFLVTGAAPRAMSQHEGLLMGAALLCGLIGYYLIVGAMRIGEVSFVTSFRYSRLVFALIVGMVFFGESPDELTLAGSALIVGSGLYALLRERRQKRRAQIA